MHIFKWIDDLFQNAKRKKIENELAHVKLEIENAITDGALDKVLYLVLEGMSLLFLVDRNYRRNIKDFKGSYVIKTEDGKTDVSAVFGKKRLIFSKIDAMTVKDSEVENPISKVSFKNGKSMIDFLLSGNPDVLKGMLSNQLSVSGNLNYLFKFVYMLMLIPDILGISGFRKMIQEATAQA
jgi:hypothetical protein